MYAELVIPVLAATIQAGTPILFATLGEMFTERAGVLNLGVEGMMILGAFFGFLFTHWTGNPWIGVLMAGTAAGMLGLLHGLVCQVFLGSQVVSGLALTILGVGLADYLGTPYVGVITEGFTPFAVPVLSSIPLAGDIFFRHDALVYLSYVMPLLFWFFICRTRAGMALRSAGENPAASAAVGLNPVRLRWMAIFAGGFLVGVGGAYLSLAYTHLWTNNMTAGRGWIAVALVIFAFWRPGRAVLGAYLFGGVMVFQLRLQAMGATLPSSLLLMLPYALTVVVLLVSSLRGGGGNAPAALGVNIEPDE
ncbi:ABC-type transporter, integral membrane subunit [Oleidesulfovibrio alaskensis G20]|jgi:simple sugar transport system permease protein|uniref:ABC-type transporter, integral membrane subunit n=1 Tax=Oleidesulfovibrio alaskensis (strain ATCC BAA-1058 / DSM 17464 / G20) TaxID=207559 RepID=Q311T8_OLEA2|nr:ABC transporter permease [Oleidesulfovibrio alaskensis]ABB38308.1 ABC-type transporter, integral membrane subunit [Oleidesulfovibrio alaskensis G20]MBG0774215.1 ABC transporter permease [Oleidesulfovibrio alaskensis]MBL3581244.1 ABC transporter permease [Oleidesulfovibrio alaskensis]